MSLQNAPSTSTSEINTTAGWDGNRQIGMFGALPGITAMGETFTVPSTTPVLQSFTFWLNACLCGTTPDMVFSSYVMAWDGTKATGKVLWRSGTITGPTSYMQRYDFAVGGLRLKKGQQYVAFLSTIEHLNEFPSTAQVLIGYGYNPYLGGHFAQLPNVSSMATLTSVPWQGDAGGDFDAAFIAEFSRRHNPHSHGDTDEDGSPLPPIVFSSDRGGNTDVYAMNADGTNQVRLTTDAATDYQPAWSPDRSKIAFVSNRSGNFGNIFTINADGSAQTQLTFGGVNYVPEWSPDGSKIAFITERDGLGGNAREVYVMSADGSNQTRLTFNGAPEGFPAWSPDGQKIIFESTRDGPNALYVMNADGSAQTRLTSNPTGNDYQPAWSPDGNHIAFASDRDGNFEVYIMKADGSSQMRLTTNTAADSKPGWAPDGSKIVFTSNRAGNDGIYLMNPDGSNVVGLTNDASNDSYGSFPLR